LPEQQCNQQQLAGKEAANFAPQLLGARGGIELGFHARPRLRGHLVRVRCRAAPTERVQLFI
jgi:hypothetical protein